VHECALSCVQVKLVAEKLIGECSQEEFDLIILPGTPQDQQPFSPYLLLLRSQSAFS